MAKVGSKEWLESISNSLKGRVPWNKGKSGYKKKPFSDTDKEHIREGVKKAWQEGKYDSVDYSKSDAQKKKLSKAKKLFYKNHPEAAKKHAEKLKGKMTGEKNPNYGKKHKGINAKEKNHFWKGGIAFEPYDDEFDRAFKRTIREREGFKCFLCFKTQKENGKALHVHHIDYEKKHTTEDNCMALCNSCHPKTQKNREFWKKYLKEQLLDRKSVV